MTYKELKVKLSKLSADQLTDTVTVYDPYTEDFTAVTGSAINDSDDILHKNHFYLELKA